MTSLIPAGSAWPVGVPLRTMQGVGCEAVGVSLDTGRRGSSAPTREGAPLPLVVAGGIAGLAAAAFPLMLLAIVSLSAWMLDPGGAQEWAQMLEAAAAGWLAGHGLPIAVGTATVSLLPLGFGLLGIAALVLASRWATTASAVARGGEAAAVIVGTTLAYALVGMATAVLARHLDVAPTRALVTCGAVAAVVSTISVMWWSGIARPDRMSAAVRATASAAVAAVLVLLIEGAVALIVALVLRSSDIGALMAPLNLGASGGLLITVLSLAYLPVAILWATAYLLGPGFVIGGDATLSPLYDATPSTMPGFPMLAALPADTPTYGMALPAVTLVAGVIAGLILRRRGCTGAFGAGLALASALLAGAIIGILGLAASGGLGIDRLAHLGPSALPLALATVAAVGIGAVGVAAWPSRSTGDGLHG